MDKSKFIEGFVLDDKGVAKGFDTHSIERFLFLPGTEKIVYQATIQSGVGLYKGKPATGDRGPDVKIPGVYDNFGNGDPKDVTWLGPVRTYTVRFTFSANGNWTWEDEIAGIVRSGNILK